MIPELLNPIYDDYKPQWKLKLGVLLRDSPIRVYREVLVPSNIRLPHLAELLIRAVGWEGYHLYEFQKDKDCYADHDTVLEYRSWPSTKETGEKWHNYANVTLGQVLKKVGDEMVFTYDLGDSWEHVVTLLERGKYAGMQAPDFFLLNGCGGCPPEDAGGVDGYRNMLDLFAHPDKDPEELESYRQWLPEGFNAQNFDSRAAYLRINDYLRTVRSLLE